MNSVIPKSLLTDDTLGKWQFRDLEDAARQTIFHKNHTIDKILEGFGKMKTSTKKIRKVESEDEDESSSVESTSNPSDSEASSSEDKKKKSKKQKAVKKKAGKKAQDGDLAQMLALLGGLQKAGKTPPPPPNDNILDGLPPPPVSLNPTAAEIAQQVVQLMKEQEEQPDKKQKAGKTGSKVAFKRVDQVYDRKIHNYKLKETVHEDPKADVWDQVNTTKVWVRLS